MKKKINYLLIVFVMFFMIPLVVYAEEKQGIIIAEPSLRLRSGPGTGYSTIDKIPYLATVTIISYDSNTEGCEGNKPWAKIRTSDNKEGYGCSRFIKESTTDEIDVSQAGQTMANMTVDEFNNYLDGQGFPESYKVKLKEIHALHPTWVFIGSKSNYTWTRAMQEQDEFVSYNGDASPGNSFLNVNPERAAQGQEGYLSTQPADYNYYTNTFIKHDGKYWFQANSAAIAHYMDPRTYLTEKSIFTFEDLTYDSAYQTEEAVKNVLSSDFLKQYSPHFMTAARNYNVSPIYLASLSRQEVGIGTDNICTNGHAGVLSDNVDYTGYYNFFNIGASSSTDPKLKSLQTAKDRGWNSPEKAIVNGAYTISVNYIQCGQHTLYYQKYNFSPKATKPIWHQYTTSINSLAPQATTTFNSYSSMGVINMAFKFDIPIFTGMPDSTPLPPLGNPNNYMSEIKVNNIALTNFDGANEKYSITIPYTESVNITGTKVATTSSVQGLGTFNMTSDTQVQNIVVTSGNGLKKTYEVTITRQAKPTDSNTEEPETPVNITLTDVISASSYKVNSGYLSNLTFGSGVTTVITNLKKFNDVVSITIKDKDNNSKSSGTVVTGDKVTIATGNEEGTYTIILYGDTNGDGIISAIDLLNVQKIIINKSNLSGAYYKAADTNKDGKISAVDLLSVQKHILGKTIISQN